MSCCKIYNLLESDSPCLLKIQENTRTIAINLFGSVVFPISDVYGNGSGFSIKTSSGLINVSSESDFTAADIEALIAECHADANTTLSLCPSREALAVADSPWQSPVGLKSLAYYVKTIGNNANPPTITANSITSDLYIDESGSWSVNNDSNSLGTITFTLNAGDEIIVNYVTLCP